MEQHQRLAARRSLKVELSEDKTCTWSVPDSDATFTMPAGVVSRLKAQVAKGFLLLPKRGAEVGGVLLGHLVSDAPLRVHIADFVPVPCEYRFGPTFTLSSSDLTGLEQILAGLPARTDVSVIGYFRSCTGREIALDSADAALLQTHFPGPATIVLSIKPLSLSECVAWLFFHQNGTMSTVPTQPAMPFDERQTEPAPGPTPIQSPAAPLLVPAPEELPPAALPALPMFELAPARATTPIPPADAPLLVPPAEELPAAAFPVVPVFEPAPAPAMEPAPAVIPDLALTPEITLHRRPYWHWVALFLMLILSTIAGYWSGVSTLPPMPPPSRPPDPAIQVFATRATKRTATPPKQRRATVRPEVVLQSEPDVPPGIRARIEQPVVIKVDVRIDDAGKVTTAKYQGDGDGLYRFLAECAARAALSSSFQPARTGDGSPVPSTALLTFVFEPPSH